MPVPGRFPLNSHNAYEIRYWYNWLTIEKKVGVASYHNVYTHTLVYIYTYTPRWAKYFSVKKENYGDKRNHRRGIQFRSVAQSCRTPRDLHGLQHARLPCPSTTPRADSNSCPSHQWCHPTISSSVIPFSSSVIPFSSHLQSFPASGSFQMSQLFPLGCQSIGLLTSASVLPMNIQGWFPLGLTGLISLQSKGFQKSSPTPQFKSINSSVFSLLYGPTLTSIHDYWKNHSLV